MAKNSSIKWQRTWRVFDGDIKEARGGVVQASRNLQDAFNTQPHTAYDANLANASRELNNSVHELRVSEGKLGASMKQMFRSFAGVFGADTSKWGSSKLPGATVEEGAREVFTKATRTHGGVVERFISKPFRIAANNPKLALTTVGLMGAGWLSSMLHGRAERNTEEALQYEVASARATAQAAAQAQPSYMNSVSPQEAAYMEAQMKQGAQAADHAASVQAAREKVPAPENAAAL
jgi:hypothetical protein